LSRLDKKVVVVTGGAGDGIGRGISTEVVHAGGTLVILDKDIVRANQLATELGVERTSAIEVDIASERDVAAAFERIGQRHGQIDVLVNSAGIGLIRAPHQATMVEFVRLFEVDFQGAWLCCRAAIPYMLERKSGAIVNIGSVHGMATMPGYSLYAGAKAGLAGFTRGLAVEYGPHGIRANLVAPGLVDGSQTRAILTDLGHDPEKWIAEFLIRHQALPTSILAQDIGRAVVFLASDDARAITGTELPVDAGALAQLASKS
jgi:NAD(P)-dependent dehydrogenase (short-subunit alcohol dehydrogenase family)